MIKSNIPVFWAKHLLGNMTIFEIQLLTKNTTANRAAFIAPSASQIANHVPLSNRAPFIKDLKVVTSKLY